MSSTARVISNIEEDLYMTNSMRNAIASNSRDLIDRHLYSLGGVAELEMMDRKAGHEYVPMDVFVDPRTMKEHFQDSSIRERWTEFHPAAA